MNGIVGLLARAMALSPDSLHAGKQPQKIAHSHVQDPRVPPALIEVGQHMLEGQLHELKTNGQDPQQRVITDDERFAPPAQSVRHHKLIKQCAFDDLPIDALVCRSEECY